MLTRKQQLENLLRDPNFRSQFVADYVQEMVATQIRAIREQRKWTQEQLGEAADGMRQVQVSRLENPDYSGVSLNSLKRVARAFDLGLIIQLAPFNEFLDWVVSVNPEKLVPPSYAEEQEQRHMEHVSPLSLISDYYSKHASNLTNIEKQEEQKVAIPA
ncbi:MAG: helix-turn-helix transcriptional regulator [Dehalococcoidia bacterium]|nr:helix-turn-helix transcriptional regulator [Dehalococcoidia bacterium]